MDPLRGHYGFLTQFHNVSEDEARQRVRQMVDRFGILEFQFYDAFEGYSKPPQEGMTEWRCRCFDRPVSRDVVWAYTTEVAKHGGRAWLYVQACGSDVDDKELQDGFKVVGSHKVNGKPLLDVVVPNGAWAERIAPSWASFARRLGFHGIHWDTLGDFENMSRHGCDLPGFLKKALPILKSLGLGQTCNFVDGFGYDRSLLSSIGWAGNTIAFPYWEVWTVPDVEDRFFREFARGKAKEGAPAAAEELPRETASVFVCYPGKSAEHHGERHNVHAKGVWPLDLIAKRWQKAASHGCTYLAIGDGLRHIQTEYFPDTLEIQHEDVCKIQVAVAAP